MLVWCTVFWTVFLESGACLQVPTDSHSPLSIHLEQAESSRATGTPCAGIIHVCRLRRKIMIRRSTLQTHGTVQHFEALQREQSSSSRASRANPSVNYFIFIILRYQFKPSREP